ncbi:hypothetical protein H3S84_03785 [Bartonella sp. W8098]|uniref:hypothetical protein n=1 Tax=Bartonella TaxID=773 RepID=UPI0018DCD869|nr:MULTISPECIES: hypothetical protein [Bartonella]MBH9987389.1 hypothetical protein [Bartonella apis]MBI0171602.1 hypothetical protein [Bartonella sp. W8151]
MAKASSTKVTARLSTRLRIDVAAAKMRASGPQDNEEDYTASIWAGVIPVTTIIGSFQPDDRLKRFNFFQIIECLVARKRRDDVLSETHQLYMDHLKQTKDK